jgi:hypothetical protein
MAAYQLTATTAVIREADGAFIPDDPANRDWIIYVAWLAAGNVPDPYSSTPAPVSQPPVLDAAALTVAIDPTGGITVGGAFNIAGAVYLGVGVYLMLFINNEVDANYFAVINADAPNTIMTSPAVDSFYVNSMDGSGNPVDATRMSVQVFRIAS